MGALPFGTVFPAPAASDQSTPRTRPDSLSRRLLRLPAPDRRQRDRPRPRPAHAHRFGGRRADAATRTLDGGGFRPRRRRLRGRVRRVGSRDPPSGRVGDRLARRAGGHSADPRCPGGGAPVLTHADGDRERGSRRRRNGGSSGPLGARWSLRRRTARGRPGAALTLRAVRRARPTPRRRPRTRPPRPRGWPLPRSRGSPPRRTRRAPAGRGRVRA